MTHSERLRLRAVYASLHRLELAAESLARRVAELRRAIFVDRQEDPARPWFVELRLDLEVSQRELARRTGIAQQTLSRLERGLRATTPHEDSVIRQALSQPPE